jgi:hypothetical protein
MMVTNKSRNPFTAYASAMDGKYELGLTPAGQKYVGFPRDVENLHLSLGLECNFRCGHCPVNKRGKIAEEYRRASQELGVDLGDPGEFTDPELLSAALEVFPNVEQVGLGCGGGEPMLNPRYDKFLQRSRNFFEARARAANVPEGERSLWWMDPYEYNVSRGGKVVDVHPGGRIVLFTNAARMPQNEADMKKYLLEHPSTTFEVSYDGYHEANYARLGRDFARMIDTLDMLAGDTSVRNAGVQIHLYHVGGGDVTKIQESFPHCLVSMGYVINFEPRHVRGAISYDPNAPRGDKFEKHAILDSQGNMFPSMCDTYSANMDRLCGRLAKVKR